METLSLSLFHCVSSFRRLEHIQDFGGPILSEDIDFLIKYLGFGLLEGQN